jgi:hypothetical protein
MSENVIKLKVPRKMRRKSREAEPTNNVIELPLQNMNITPQELLAKLSRNPNITQVLVIFPEDDPNDDTVQHTHVVSANMTLADVNYAADKAKLNAMGFET